MWKLRLREARGLDQVKLGFEPKLFGSKAQALDHLFTFPQRAIVQ